MAGWPDGYPSKGPWAFRNVTQSFDFDCTLESISISQLHPDGIMAFAGDVVDEDEDITFVDDDELRVTFGGVRIFAGHLRVRQRTLLTEFGPRVWGLTGQDYTAKLDDSVILTETERPRESIAARVAWILGHLNYSLTTAGVNLPSENVEPNVYEGNTVREALQQVSDEKLLHFYADFSKDLHMFRTENVAAPFDLSADPNYTTTFPFSEFDLQTDTIELTNAVRVKGARHRAWRTDATSIGIYGRQESAIVDDSLRTMEQVIAAGNRRLYQLAEPIVDGALTCWEPGMYAGQTFQLTHESWGIDDETYIVTEVEITAVEPHDEEGEAHLRSAIRFSDKRRVGRFPGAGKDVKEDNQPGGGSPRPPEDVPGGCCNPVPTGPEPFISWGEANILGFEQGHTSGTSHSIVLPDGSGYPGGVVAGDVTDRIVLVFWMEALELPNSSTVDDPPSPWDPILSGGIACTHGVFPFNNGHPHFKKRGLMFEVDPNPGDYPETGATLVLSSDDATEVLWVSILIGGVGGVTTGPGTTDWDMADWSSSLPVVDTGNRALYFSLAFNRYWNNTEHGLGLSAEQHDTPVIGGLPADFARLTQAVGGEKTMNVDYAYSPVNTGSGLPTLSMTGYIGSSSGSQDFIETRLFGVEVAPAGTGRITPGPTWEGGNPLDHNISAPDPPSFVVDADGVLTITSDDATEGFSYSAVGPPDLPTSIGDWIISQQFNLDVAGSLTDDGSRYLEIAADFDGQYLAASVRFGDANYAQGVLIDDEENTFVAKDITEGEETVFQVKWDGVHLYARFWLLADGPPAADVWDVTSVTLEEGTSTDDDQLDRFFYNVGIGNDGSAMVLVLQPPTIEGLALAGESVDWEIVGYGDGTTVTFPTRYPFDELTLQVKVDEELLGGTAFDDIDGAAGTFTLIDAPYGDPVEGDAGSAVVKARYTRV